jgi:hypothetical protein
MRLPLAASLSLSLLALTLGCGGSGGGSSNPGTLNLLLGADTFAGYQHVWVTMDKIESSSDNSHWGTLSSTKQTVDLMALENGRPATLVNAGSFAPGDCYYVRITWGTAAAVASQGANYVIDNAGNATSLVMPTSTTLSTSFHILSDQTVNAQLTLNALQAIQVRSGSYTFQPTGTGYDLGSCATLQGQLTAGGAPLSGVEVYAETVDGSLEPSIQRSALTDANGNYVLDALPASSSAYYYVVAQPAGTSSAYLAMVGTVPAATHASYTTNLAFTNVNTPGTVMATVTPASLATQSTWVQLRQAFNNQALIVRSLPVTTGTSVDAATFAGLYPGTYGIAAMRSTSGGTPVKAMPVDALTNQTVPVTPTPGGTSVVSISY